MSHAPLVGGTNGAQNHIHQIQALAGRTAERLDEETLAATSSPDSLDAFVPENLEAVEVKNAATTHFKAKNADLLRKLVSDNSLDRIVERDQVINYTAFPFSCSGKLFVGANSNFVAPLWTGSAAIVGRNLLLTASHCAPWNTSGTGGMTGWWMRFVPSYNNGTEPRGSSYVSDFRGVENTDDVTGLDYVICRLYKPLGDQCGWLGSQWWKDNSPYLPPNSWSSVGYPGDAMNGQVMMVERGISLHQVDTEGAEGRELESHTFSTPGWSGGAMFGTLTQQERCVGVLSGKEFENDGLTGVFGGQHWHSVSAGGEAMVNLIKYGLANWA